MKTLTEIEEMLIFDYLEGNLSIEEQEKVQNLLENNENFKSEFLAMQNAFLPPFKIDYINKSSLLKHRPFIFYNKTFAIAASLLLLVGSAILLMTNQNKSENALSVCKNSLPTISLTPYNNNQIKSTMEFAVNSNSKEKKVLNIQKLNQVDSIQTNKTQPKFVFEEYCTINKRVLASIDNSLIFDYNPPYVSSDYQISTPSKSKIGFLASAGNFYSRTLQWIKPPAIRLSKENKDGQKQYVLSFTAPKYELLAFFK